MKCFILLVFLGCALGSSTFRSIRDGIHNKFQPMTRPTEPRITNAPGNCDPKKLPRFPNFDASSITGPAFIVLSTPQDILNVDDLADQMVQLSVNSYKRPDGTLELLWIYDNFVAFRNGFCVNGTNVYKFGQGQDSATLNLFDLTEGTVQEINIYVLAVDAYTGTTAYYFEALFDGVYQDNFSYIFITVTDPSRPLDLSGVNGALVQFCGREALKDGFFEMVNRNTSVECNPDLTGP